MRSPFAIVILLSATTFVPADGPTAENYARHADALRAKLPPGFTVVVQAPFVVVGDGTPESVRHFSTNTVKWAVDRLKQDFFAKDPDEILDIYLFKDADSYSRYTREFFHDTPSTPYGYYSPTHHALIMNIATGGGTLVHEIVHPFMRANFPACPAWFNEGLGSLFEQCADKEGHIAGLTNWRLPGLQRAIRAGNSPSLTSLLATSSDEFYGDRAGVNYAAARYLCYYLQERGLLHSFYREFSANHKDDPTGLATLCKTLRRDDLATFQKEWEAYVLTLRFK